MSKLSRALTNYEEIRLGNETLKIEHDPLENVVGCGLIFGGAIIASPFLVLGGMYYLGKEGKSKLFEVGKRGYNKVKQKYFKKIN